MAFNSGDIVVLDPTYTTFPTLTELEKDKEYEVERTGEYGLIYVRGLKNAYNPDRFRILHTAIAKDSPFQRR